MTNKEAHYLRQKIRQRIDRIRDKPDLSQTAVKQFDDWVDIYNNMGTTFSKMNERRFDFMTRELERIDALTTSTSKGARDQHQTATKLFGEDYTSMTTDERNSVWDKFNSVRHEFPDLDSDQVKILSDIMEEDSNVGVTTRTDKFGNTQAVFTYNGKKLDRRLKATRILEEKLQNYDKDDYTAVLYKAINRR